MASCQQLVGWLVAIKCVQSTVKATNMFIFYRRTNDIGVAPITKYTHVRNRNSNSEGSSRNIVKVIFYILRTALKEKKFAPSGSKFLPLREVPTLERDIIVEIIA